MKSEGSKRGRRSLCQHMRSSPLSGQQTCNCCRISTPSLHPISQALHRIFLTVPPWGGAAEQHSSVQRVQHAPRLHRVFYSARQRESVLFEEMRKRVAQRDTSEESLIRNSSAASFFLNLYENSFSSSACSRVLLFPSWLKAERMRMFVSARLYSLQAGV